MRQRVAVLLPVVLTIACRETVDPQPREPAFPERPAFEIRDGAHGSGNVHFFFLPPIVAQPSFTGTFDSTFSPIVDICEWSTSGCALPLIAEFTTTSGPGSETVRLDARDQLYTVSWHTALFHRDTTRVYRIIVRVSAIKLGYSDVEVVTTKQQAASVDRTQFVPVLNGTTLPIKFRIEKGAPCAEEAECGDQVIGSLGGVVTTSNGVAGIQIPSGALNRAIHAIVRKVSAPCLPGTYPGVGSCFEILTDQEVTLGLAVTVAICTVVPSAAGTIYKYEPAEPSLGVQRLASTPASFLDCGSVKPGMEVVGGLATSFSVAQVVIDHKWSAVAAGIPRARPQVTPLVSTINTSNPCPGSSFTAFQTGTAAQAVLVTGGVSSVAPYPAIADIEVISGWDGQTWTGHMLTSRVEHTATLLSDGTVLITGGLSSDGHSLASAELFFPGILLPGHQFLGSFESVGSMTRPRWRHTASLLDDGRVLVAGGIVEGERVGDVDTATVTAEIYDPRTKTFQSTGNMHFPRERHAAAGTLISGGSGSAQSAQTLEQFVISPNGPPSQGTFKLAGSLAQPHIRHTATLIPYVTPYFANGTGFGSVALIYGGGVPGSATTYAEVLANGGGVGWVAIQPPIETPYVRDQEAVLWGCSSVVVAGGTGADGQPTDRALLFYVSGETPGGLPIREVQLQSLPSPQSLHGAVSLIGHLLFIEGNSDLTVGSPVFLTQNAIW